MALPPEPGIERAIDLASSLVRSAGADRPPVPVATLIQQEGFEIREGEIPEHGNDIYGFLNLERSPRAVVLNSQTSLARKGFSLAQALGLWLLAAREVQENAELGVLLRRSLEEESHELRRLANIFAAYLMVPREWLPAYLTRHPVIELPSIFMIPEDVLAYRLKLREELELLPESRPAIKGQYKIS